MTSESLFKDYDLSSISGSDDEDDKESGQSNDLQRRLVGDIKNKIFLKLHNGEILSLWKGLLLNESESILFENKKTLAADDIRNRIYLTENEVIKKLKYLIHEPRDNTLFRIVLLARGGHFAGCVFDGTTAVAHKTFHRLESSAGKSAVLLLCHFLRTKTTSSKKIFFLGGAMNFISTALIKFYFYLVRKC